MRLAVLVVAGVLAAAPAAAFTGNQLLSNCAATSEPFIHGYCMGFIAGVTASMSTVAPMVSTVADGAGICPPNTITNQQATDVVVKFLQDNPSIRHLPAAGLVHVAMMGAYPCSAR